MTKCGDEEGEEINCKQLCQLHKSDWMDPDMVIIQVEQLAAVTKYYKAAGTINMHNRIHTDELRMDRNLTTKDWAKRFNLGILGIVCVDAYL